MYVNMSRNDLIGVARIGAMYYVLYPLNADTQWDARVIRRMVMQRRFAYRTRSRGNALIYAHDVQRHHVVTEYGVREIWAVSTV